MPATGGEELELARLRLEEARQRAELELKREELELKRRDLALREREHRQANWRSPLALGVAAAVIGLLGNAVVAALNGYFGRQLEGEKAERQAALAAAQHKQSVELERSKAEAGRILEVVKTGDPEQAASNLRFLVEAGLAAEHAEPVKRYLAAPRPAGTGIALSAAPPPGGIVGRDSARPIAPGDTFAPAARPVGLLRVGTSVACTAFVVGEDLVLTAGHCVTAGGALGKGDESLTFEPVGAEATAGKGGAAARFAVTGPPVELHAPPLGAGGADPSFALLRVEGAPGKVLGWLTLSPEPPVLDEPLGIILTRGAAQLRLSAADDCRVFGVTEAEFEHRCDTGPGSGGSPVLTEDGRVVGVHYRTRGAVRADAILKASPTLRAQVPDETMGMARRAQRLGVKLDDLERVTREDAR